MNAIVLPYGESFDQICAEIRQEVTGFAIKRDDNIESPMCLNNIGHDTWTEAIQQYHPYTEKRCGKPVARIIASHMRTFVWGKSPKCNISRHQVNNIEAYLNNPEDAKEDSFKIENVYKFFWAVRLISDQSLYDAANGFPETLEDLGIRKDFKAYKKILEGGSLHPHNDIEIEEFIIKKGNEFFEKNGYRSLQCNNFQPTFQQSEGWQVKFDTNHST